MKLMTPAFQVLLVGNYLPDRQTSMQRFAHSLQVKLPDCGVRTDLIRPEPRFGRLISSPSGLGKWFGYVDKFALFPHVLRRRCRERSRSDRRMVVHICDHSNSVYSKWLDGVSHLVTCHDLLAVRSALGEIPENPTRWSGRQLQRMIVDGLKRAHHVTCVSEATRRELLRLSRVPPERTSVVWNGLNYPFAPMPLATARGRVARLIQALAGAHRAGNDHHGGGDLPRFILSVGANAWYKNKTGVVRAYAELRAIQPDCPFLVMAGAPIVPEVHELIAAKGLSGLVFEVVECSSEDLRALYSTAELLLLPSLAEGFGWPIIEAQACGCRVVTADRAPMTEIGGQGTAYCDPRDPPAIARRVKEVLSEPEATRSERIRMGFENAARFSSEQNVQAYAGVYQRLVHRSNGALQ